MKRTASTFLVLAFSTLSTLSTMALLGSARAEAPSAAPKPAAAAAQEVTLKGMLGCGKCSFQQAKACQNVLKVKDGDKEVSYELADNEVARANHEKVCGPASPATVTGTVAEGKQAKPGKNAKTAKKVLTATTITFD